MRTKVAGVSFRQNEVALVSKQDDITMLKCLEYNGLKLLHKKSGNVVGYIPKPLISAFEKYTDTDGKVVDVNKWDGPTGLVVEFN